MKFVTYFLIPAALVLSTADGESLRKLDAGGGYVPPTPNPTPRPTARPTNRPTRPPTNPTPRPTPRPTVWRPTNRPTNRPTRSPTRRPTPAPTVSFMPSLSLSPTLHQAPDCGAQYTYCWDGSGSDYGWGYAQCAVMDISMEEGNCGNPYSYYINGHNYTSNNPIDFEECYNVWTWFQQCISLSFASCEKQANYGTFDFRDFKYFDYWESNGQWVFRMKGTEGTCYEDCNSDVRWYCDNQDDALAIREFALWVSGDSIIEDTPTFFEAKEYFCETSAPSSTTGQNGSPAPAGSPGPPCGNDEAFCVDTMDNIKCSVIEVEGDCPGPYEYIITSVDGTEILRENSLKHWLPMCLEAFGCHKYAYKEEDEEAFYFDKISFYQTYADWHDPPHFVQVKMSGSLYYQYFCPTAELAGYIQAFEAALDDKYANKVGMPWSCPEPTATPTISPAPVPATPQPTRVASSFPTSTPSATPTYATAAPTVCSDSYFYNPPLYILVVIDVSYSTYITDFTQGGVGIGDVNLDGAKDTVLDAEIQATMALLNTVLETDGLDNSNINIGLVTFETSAIYHGNFNPLSDDNSEINPILENYLKKPWTLTNANDVIGKNQGYTNMDDALDKGIEYFSDETRPDFGDATKLMVFLGDGIPNVRGDGDDEDWCPGEDMDCTTAPSNNYDMDAPQWEQGSLSFCYSGDIECWKNQYVYCARGYNATVGSSTDCKGTEVTKSFDSELAELNRLGVLRLSIGVGSDSDTSVDSALWRIDNSPSKEMLGLEPRTVLNADDLIDALRELCPYNTPHPTDSPSASPTQLPSTDPSPSPTSLPSVTPSVSASAVPTSHTASPTTTAPTTTPSSEPTSGPSASPTVDVCEYIEIDFSVEMDTGANTEHGMIAYPGQWMEYGLVITATPDPNGDEAPVSTEPALFYNTQTEAGMAIVVPYDGEFGDLVMNPAGGSLDITLDMTHDKTMRIDLYDVDSGVPLEGGSINLKDEDGMTVGGVSFPSKAGELQTITVSVIGVHVVSISFFGTGALAQLNVCRNPSYTPSPVGLSSPSQLTYEPSSTPTEQSSSEPTSTPTKQITLDPTSAPTEQVTLNPTAAPTGKITLNPTAAPTEKITLNPTAAPTEKITLNPTAAPTNLPTPSPSLGLSNGPTFQPSVGISMSPTPPSPSPTPAPSAVTLSPVNTVAPVTPTCPDDIKLISFVGTTEYEDIPITIVDRDARTVTLEIRSPFTETVAWIFADYVAGRSEECVGFEEVSRERVETITAECLVSAPITLVHIYALDTQVLNSELDLAPLPPCCHGPDGLPTVEYTFRVSCVPQCPDGEVDSV